MNQGINELDIHLRPGVATSDLRQTLERSHGQVLSYRKLSSYIFSLIFSLTNITIDSRREAVRVACDAALRSPLAIAQIPRAFFQWLPLFSSFFTMTKPDPIPRFVEIRPNTLKMYAWQLRRFQGWLKHKPWLDVIENDLIAYKNYLKTKPTRGGSTGLKPNSINQALAAIQSFYKWLYIRRYVTFNPALTIEMATPSPPKPKDLEISTIHELDEGLAYRGLLCTRDTAIVWVLKHGL